MTKTELVDLLYGDNELPSMTKKTLRQVVDSILSSMEGALSKGEKVELHGFGNFVVRQRAARTARSPITKEPLSIPAKKVVVFRPSSRLKGAVDTKGKKKKK